MFLFIIFLKYLTFNCAHFGKVINHRKETEFLHDIYEKKIPKLNCKVSLNFNTS